MGTPASGSPDETAPAGARTGGPAAHQPVVEPRVMLRLTALGALLGLPVGIVSYLFFVAVHELEGLLWDDLPDALGLDAPPWYLVVGLPVVGGALVWCARRLPGDGGHSPIEGLSMTAVHPRDAASVVLAALATLPFGIVLGPEAPLIALGAAAGTWLTQRARLAEHARVSMGIAGSGAAMSTLFGGPLVAGLMLLESGVGAGALVISLILPALVSAAVAYTLITGIGTWTGLPMAGLALPGLPTYETVLVRDLVLAVAVGVVAVLVARLVRNGATRIRDLEPGVGRFTLLVGGGLAVGLLALAVQGLGGDSQDVLFSGQSGLPSLVAQETAGAVLLLLAAKALAFAVSMGAGFRGGPIFPAVYLGVALATLGAVVFDLSPTVAIALGTAAGMTAMTRMVVTPVLFAGLLVGRAGLDAIPVAVVATATAWLASAVLDHRALRREQASEAVRPQDAAAASAPAPVGAVLPVPHADGPEAPATRPPVAGADEPDEPPAGLA